MDEAQVYHGSDCAKLRAMSNLTLIMIDGLRPDAIAGHCPNLQAVMARGAFTLNAASVMPCITLPCHTSIFHSVPPARHGITTNEWHTFARPLPGLVEVASLAGKRCAIFYNWEQLRDISRPGQLAHASFRDCVYSLDGDDWVVEEALRVMPQVAFDFAFVYFGTVDTVGHDHGWMSPEYLAQAQRVDAALGRLLSALPADGHVLIQADHGGHDRTHGTEAPEDMTIPWVVAGPRVRQNHSIASGVSLLDTAPTLAHLLGLKPHTQWEGKVVDEIFI